TFTATVTANSGSAAPAAGVVKFIDSGASGTVLATATTATTSGATATFTVAATVPAGSYSHVQAYFFASASSGFSSSISPIYGSTPFIGTATTTVLASLSPTHTPPGLPSD